MRVRILGCGTSGGVPSVTGDWGACDPDNPKNRRSRASILVEEDGQTLLFDTSPDLRQQLLAASITHLDAVFYTHDHADHTHGIDDLRHLALRAGRKLPLYGDAETLALLKTRFAYIFRSLRHYPAIARGVAISGPKRIGGVRVIPFEQIHGRTLSYGYRVGDMAYSTDLNSLPESSFEALGGLRLWIVDALRHTPHPTHAHLDLTLDWIARIKPERAILTHMANDMDYDTLKTALPIGVEPAYDGMVLEL